MTQDATTQTPLQALQSTLSVKLGVPPPIGNAFVAPGCEPFLAKLDHLEAEGAALLQTAETHIEDAGYTIVEIGNHALHPRTVAPHHIDMARALPLARAGDVLHESEHAVIRAFMDAEDVLRRVYLNVHGWWVKA